jgi:site-specific DNA-methyltransferase (adenine-specific)
MNENGDGGYNITKNHLIQKGESSKRAKEWEGWGSALKPAVEPIVVCRKPLEKGLSIAENVLKWGVGGINIDGCRVGEEVAKEYTSQDTQGRFPANIILTHHPECECKGFKKVKPLNGSGKASEKGGGFSKGMFGDGKSDNIGGGFVDENGEENVENWNCHPDCPCYIMDRQSGESKSSDKKYDGKDTNTKFGQIKSSKRERGYRDKGGASRFFYQAKASKSERNRGLEGFANNHPTIKPVKLMQYLVRLVTPPNGLVLDPFCGSGTTGIACRLEGFNFVGMEREEDYAKIAQARIDNWFGASDKEGVPESSSLVESASAEDSASARLEPPKEIPTQLKFNF